MKTCFEFAKLLLFFALILSGATSALAQPDSLRITVTEGTNMSAALSPNGQSIVVDLQGTIWLMPAKGGTARALTDFRDDARQPAWSPDSKRIVYSSFRDGTFHIYSVKPDGSDLQKHTKGEFDNREPSYSPDGSKLIFSSDHGGNYNVFELTLKTGELKQLTDNAGNEYAPSYSSDGKRIAYVATRPDASGLYVWEGGKETLAWKTAATLGPPAWSLNGQSLIVQTAETGKTALIVKDLKPDSEPKVISATGEDVFPFRPSVATDGSIWYTADGGIKHKTADFARTDKVTWQATLALQRKPYTRKTYLLDNAKPRPVKGIRAPVVSPDGKSIAFSALGDLYWLDIGNPTPKKLTDDAFIEADPTFSPDGRFLVFVSDRSGSINLWARDLKTGQDRQLTNGTEEISTPVFSPDSKHIAFFMLDRAAFGRSVLHTLDVPPSEDQPTPVPKKIHDALFGPGVPSWSPDGKQIAVSALDVYSSRFREGLNQFLVIPSGGSGSALELKPDSSGQTISFRGRSGPAWSPDGHWMAYVLDGVLWTLPVTADGKQTGSPVQRTKTLADNMSWTADSKTLVYLAVDTLKQLDITTNRVSIIPLNFTYQAKLPTDQTIIHAGKLFDGKTNAYRENVDIVLKGSRIQAIEPHKAGRTGKLIDASKLTVMPGLWEMHTHQSILAGEKQGRIWLSHGITSIRETGADPYDALERREAWDAGIRPGPRSFYTGTLNEGYRLYYGLATSIRSEAQLRMELDRAKRLDYDLLKCYVRLPDRLQQLAADLAHQIGIPVTSHELYPAVKYNIDGVEHSSATSRRGFSPKLTSTNHIYGDVLNLIAKSGMNMTPTTSLQGGFGYQTRRDTALFSYAPYMHFYDEKYRTNMMAQQQTMRRMMPGAVENFKTLAGNVKKFIAAGGRVTPGTDSPLIPYGLSLQIELQNWVEGGVTPFETLRGATLWSAEAAGVGKDVGSIEVGKIADLIAVDGDPLTKIRDTMNVKYTIKNGQVWTLAELLK
ncbi:amidohydrolase family protein [Spirosoma aureum]|uniref:Amidohydrolase family protein n=1 Tax=Spirosoma aureum TaxID=2692134 RepID=A0A6G9AJ62_9BACT|nr:DPP IV N-terminal domain-containing protein [Spirosoma aureum]QIP12359.1 amidohydrolase family protein [Spirosoma aureum]